jgi:hypothetical protein
VFEWKLCCSYMSARDGIAIDDNSNWTSLDRVRLSEDRLRQKSVPSGQFRTHISAASLYDQPTNVVMRQLRICLQVISGCITVLLDDAEIGDICIGTTTIESSM